MKEILVGLVALAIMVYIPWLVGTWVMWYMNCRDANALGIYLTGAIISIIVPGIFVAAHDVGRAILHGEIRY